MISQHRIPVALSPTSSPTHRVMTERVECQGRAQRFRVSGFSSSSIKLHGINQSKISGGQMHHDGMNRGRKPMNIECQASPVFLNHLNPPRELAVLKHRMRTKQIRSKHLLKAPTAASRSHLSPGELQRVGQRLDVEHVPFWKVDEQVWNA